MFDRFLRFAEIRRAMQQGQYETALRLLDDPVVRDHRRAAEWREEALRGLVGRAKRRADLGQIDAALADMHRVITHSPEHGGAQTLQRNLTDRAQQQRSATDEARKLLRAARAQAEAGNLVAALESCAAAARLHSLPVEEQALRELVHGRRAEGTEAARRAAEALAAGDVGGAREHALRARGCDEAALAALTPTLVPAIAAAVAAQARAARRNGDLDEALAALVLARAQFPGVVESREFAAATRELELAARDEVVAQLERNEIDSGLALARAAAAGTDSPLVRAVAAVARAHDLERRGDFHGAGEALAAAAATLDSKPLAARARDWAAEANRCERELTEARSFAAGGDLPRARAHLVAVLERWPMHEAARRELAVMEGSARDREQRLADVRALAGDGKLGEAYGAALVLAVPGPAGDEARLVLKDLRARLDLVTTGLDQVRRAVHGREGGSVEGLGHCLAKLEQLTRLQSDEPELERLRGALGAEVEGLELVTALREAVTREAARDARAKVDALVELQPRLLQPDRLDARILEIADRMVTTAGTAVAAGRLAETRAWLAAVEPLTTGRPALAERLAPLRAQLEERARTADELARRGIAALDARDVARAESCLEGARAQSVNGSAVVALEQALAKLRAQEAALTEVETLTAAKDYGAAQRRLEDMPPTPGPLRTRIFDIKQGLARAQGLDRGFLLRVDEGGELLVVRGDTISIGNLRDGSSDLPILANIAGRHASLRRSMSFHGGLEDAIVAEHGELRVNGELTPRHRLTHGDRMRLGSSLELVYEVPSKRSLTARLVLRGGFQVAGTDKVLLLKDRGRDGRILLGAAADVHVRLPHARGEIELFASKDGQIRVRFDGQGEINGRPFRGEHPVVPGAPIHCANVSLVLLPWAGA